MTAGTESFDWRHSKKFTVTEITMNQEILGTYDLYENGCCGQYTKDSI